MAVEEFIDRLRGEIERLNDHRIDGSLMLVDLAGSTAYKTAQPQEAWLPRLLAFRRAVEDAISPLRPTKYLGDGILVFAGKNCIDPAEFLQLAGEVYKKLAEINHNYTDEHAIRARIILGYGPVFLFDGKDPQGSAVDKLFRLEKYVPNGCVGMSEEFLRQTQGAGAQSIGHYRLKGLTQGLHELFLLKPLDDSSLKQIDNLQCQEALRGIWDLGTHRTGPITIITGSIPPEVEGADMIQMGDKDALVSAVINIATVGRIGDLRVRTCDEDLESDLCNNVVCIGGPYYNSVALQFMKEIRSPFIFDMSDPEGDRTPILSCLDDSQIYKADWNDNRLMHDFGFFGRFSNPYNSECHVILACGIETSGVFGIVKAFSPENPHFLSLYKAILEQSDGRHELLDFFCLMKFQVRKNGMPRVPSRDEQLPSIVTKWTDNHNGQIQQEPILD